MSFLSQRIGLTRFEADEYYAKALEAYEKNQLDEAITHIDFALTLLPQNSEYHAVRGLFFMEDGNSDPARESFTAALNLHEAELLANYGMGVLAFRDKQWDEAREWFNKARTVNPTQVELPYYLALVYHRQQDNKTAKAYMEQALELMEDAGDKRRSSAKRWLREFDKLIKEAETIREEKPTQRELPIQGAGSGTSVSRTEIEGSKTAGALGTGANDTDN